MKYVLGIIYAILIGILGGWSIYNSCAGSKKDRLFAGIIWGVGIAIIFILVVFGVDKTNTLCYN